MSIQNKNNIDINNLDSNMTIKISDASGLLWYAPSEKPFRLAGFNWFEHDKVYRRLPVKPKPALPDGVESLAWCTAGGQIKFQTDSSRIGIKVKLRNPSNMDHMPQTGQSGFDLYVGALGKEHFYSVSRFGLNIAEYNCELFKNDQRKLRNFILNFPLYNGVEDVQVGLDENCCIEAPPAFADERPVVVYGTSITQGGCASKPGACYTNILSRKLNVPFINLGFSGSGKGEPEVAEHIGRIENPAMFILDYEANCGSVEQLNETLPEFVSILRTARPVTPILVVSKIRYGQEALDSKCEKASHTPGYREACKQIQLSLVKSRSDAGDKNIHFFDGSTLLGEDYFECSVDGVHPTDMGFFRMAAGLEPAIRKILFNKK